MNIENEENDGRKMNKYAEKRMCVCARARATEAIFYFMPVVLTFWLIYFPLRIARRLTMQKKK